jgi:hypothetical protein
LTGEKCELKLEIPAVVLGDFLKKYEPKAKILLSGSDNFSTIRVKQDTKHGTIELISRD